MRRVYICQLKCPSNHCLLACAAPFDSFAEAEQLKSTVQKKFTAFVESGLIISECFICKSGGPFRIDLGVTRFETMEEAEAFFREEQNKQLETQLFLHQSKN